VQRFGRLREWLDGRIGLKDLEKLAQKKRFPSTDTPSGTTRRMTLFLFMVQVSTGILLLLYYGRARRRRSNPFNFSWVRCSSAG